MASTKPVFVKDRHPILRFLEDNAMPKSQIRIVVEGMPENSFLIRANDFIKVVSTMLGAVTTIDRIISGRGPKGAASFNMNIIELSYGSPAVLAIEQISKDPSLDIRGQVNNKLFSAYNSVVEGTFEDSALEYSIIEHMIGMGKMIGTCFKSIQFSANGNSVTIDSEYRAKMDLALAKDITYPGFIRGDLDYINIHASSRVFKIYPTIGPYTVTCYFPEELKRDAIAAISRHVEVHGTLHYKKMSKYPHQIIVKEMRLLAAEEELPGFSELLGIARGIPTEISSEQLIRTMRDGN